MDSKHALVGLALVACAAWSQATTSPAASAPSAPHGMHAHREPLKPGKAAAAKPLVDINSASRDKLKTLPGVDDATADKIIAGRPYLSKADLLSKKVVRTGTYVSLRRLIIAKPKLKPNGQPEMPAKSG